MPYQNNNNRVKSDFVEDLTLNPQAAPVDKLIKYQPDLAEASRTRANAEALVKIGQGIIDYDIHLQKAAQESALVAYEKTEAINNKKEWERVSKNVEGMAKFNPYIKDSYKRLVAQDIYRSSVLKINSNPNLSKMSESEFYQFINDTKQEMLKAANLEGISEEEYLKSFQENGGIGSLNYADEINTLNELMHTRYAAIAQKSEEAAQIAESLRY